MVGSIAVQQFFEEAFVSESGQIVCRANLVHKRQRNSPGHPLPRNIRQIPTAAQESFHHLDFAFSEAVEFSGKSTGLNDRRNAGHSPAMQTPAQTPAPQLRARARRPCPQPCRPHAGPRTNKNRDQSDRIKRRRHHVESAQQIPDRRFPKCDRPAIFANHSQLQPALARSLSIPDPFEESEVTGEESRRHNDRERPGPISAHCVSCSPKA